jgi:hypothetical protein
MSITKIVMIFKRLFTKKIELQVSHLSDFIIESATPDTLPPDVYPSAIAQLPYLTAVC